MNLINLNYFPLLYFFLLVLYGIVGYSSFGYDDELFNIKLIERYGLGAISIVQQTDVHPPGSYLVNWALFALLDDWKLVRLVGALFSAGTLIYVIESVRKKNGFGSGLKAFILLGLNPAILLWCTGLRWYAYFVPILIWLSVTPKTGDWRYWAKCFAGLFLLAYFGYAAFILAIPLLVLYWRNCSVSITVKIRNILVFGGIFWILYLYQLTIFISIHLSNKDSQVFSLWKGVMGFIVAQMSNQGVFPFSFPGIFSAIGFFGIFLIIFRYSLSIELRRNQYLLSYWIGIVFIIISGLAGKFRNFVALSPWQGLWISTAYIDVSRRKIFAFFISLVFFGNMAGIFNVVMHNGTTKNSWNLPVHIVLNNMKSLIEPCNNDMAVMTHDPTLAFVLEKRGLVVLSPYTINFVDQSILQRRYQCVIILMTYPGSISDQDIKEMYEEVNLLNYKSAKSYSFGFDTNYKIKQLLDARYPEYQVQVIELREVDNLDKAMRWRPTL